MPLRTYILSSFTVSLIAMIFLKAYKMNSFVLVHRFAEEHGDVEFRVVGKHDLFLNTSLRKCSTSYKLISKINFNISKIILNIFLILSKSKTTQFFSKFIPHKFSYRRLTDLSPYSQISLTILIRIKLSFKILNDTLSFELTVFENEIKVILFVAFWLCFLWFWR